MRVFRGSRVRAGLINFSEVVVGFLVCSRFAGFSGFGQDSLGQEKGF